MLDADQRRRKRPRGSDDLSRWRGRIAGANSRADSRSPRPKPRSNVCSINHGHVAGNGEATIRSPPPPPIPRRDRRPRGRSAAAASGWDCRRGGRRGDCAARGCSPPSRPPLGRPGSPLEQKQQDLQAADQLAFLGLAHALYFLGECSMSAWASLPARSNAACWLLQRRNPDRSRALLPGMVLFYRSTAYVSINPHVFRASGASAIENRARS